MTEQELANDIRATYERLQKLAREAGDRDLDVYFNNYGAGFEGYRLSMANNHGDEYHQVRIEKTEAL